jgi:hypothetical protein
MLQTSDWQLRSPLVGWQHMVRTIIQVRVCAACNSCCLLLSSAVAPPV